MARNKRDNDAPVAFIWHLRINSGYGKILERYLGESRGFKAVHERFLFGKRSDRPGQGFKKFQGTGEQN